jgi:hypothetical protein
METKFEGGYIRNEKFAKEYYFYHAYKNTAGIFITVACACAVLIGIILTAMQQYLAIIDIVLGLYILLLRYFRTKKIIKLSLERDRESNHGNVVSVQNLVTDEAITVISSNNTAGTEFEMSCITKLYSSKNYIYLITKAKLAIVFDKNNFSKGSKEELIEFIRSKGIKVK